jgi:hypothetical protein
MGDNKQEPTALGDYSQPDPAPTAGKEDTANTSADGLLNACFAVVSQNTTLPAADQVTAARLAQQMVLQKRGYENTYSTALDAALELTQQGNGAAAALHGGKGRPVPVHGGVAGCAGEEGEDGRLGHQPPPCEGLAWPRMRTCPHRQAALSRQREVRRHCGQVVS